MQGPNHCKITANAYGAQVRTARPTLILLHHNLTHDLPVAAPAGQNNMLKF